MYAMQYELNLPADYDMGVIRKRVADFGTMFDDRTGLGFKAFLIRERGRDGSPVNQYAPFYLWQETGAMAHFLAGGGGFQAIVRDFGRPSVQHWTAVAGARGPSRATPPRAAARRITAIPEDADSTGMGLASRIERESTALAALAQRDGVHTAVLGVDPRHWQLVRFVLWRDAIPRDEDATERYEVLHLSVPDPTRPQNGLLW